VRAVRAFIAVALQGRVVGTIEDFISDLRHRTRPVKWVERQNLHITLKFLGDVPEDRIPALSDSVARAAAVHSKFRVSFIGLGAFPNPGKARVVWVGIDRGGAELEALAKSVEAETVGSGFPPQDKPFRAHLTIGRVKGDAPPGPELVEAIVGNAQRRFGVMPVETVRVMASKLTPDGPIYTCLAQAPLS
jgi:2'-5' RNA ligase